MSRWFAAALILTGLVGPAFASGDHGHHDDHDDHHEEATGPHGGRLLEQGTLAVEVSIFETGVAPQLRVYFYDGDEVLDPAEATLELTLHRLARGPEKFSFTPTGDFLLGDHPVAEPHSYEVEVTAFWGSQRLEARYETLEGRVSIPEDVAKASGVGEAVAGPRDLARTRRLTGRIGIPSDRLAELHPRFAGVVREATGQVGDRVEAGQGLAVVENSQTLSRFSVDSPLTGILLSRRAVVGNSVNVDDVLYAVADLGEVWADFDVYREDTGIVRIGETVTVHDDSGRDGAQAVLSYISPLRDVHTQTMLARALLPNREGRWAPGAFINGFIAIAEEPAAVAVPLSALQTWRGMDAVFVHAEGVWEVRPVHIGRRGDEWIEVIDGLEPGTTVATGNTFLLRAEIEKAGASHDH